MIMYTTMPLDVVMERFEERQAPVYVDVTVNGIQMQVQPLNDRQASIVRIMSGNPQHYLNPQYAPGQLIEFQPAIASRHSYS